MLALVQVHLVVTAVLLALVTLVVLLQGSVGLLRRAVGRWTQRPAGTASGAASARRASTRTA